MSLFQHACGFCRSTSIKHVSNCFTPDGKELCELWYCIHCRKFFPDKVLVDPESLGESIMEKRQHHRFNINFVVEVLLADGDSFNRHGPIIATVINASGGGVCFLFPRPIAEGTEARFRISLPSVPRSFEAKGRIVRCIETPDGSHGIAVDFYEVDIEYKAQLERYVTLNSIQSTQTVASVKEGPPPARAGIVKQFLKKFPAKK